MMLDDFMKTFDKLVTTIGRNSVEHNIEISKIRLRKVEAEMEELKREIGLMESDSHYLVKHEGANIFFPMKKDATVLATIEEQVKGLDFQFVEYDSCPLDLQCNINEVEITIKYRTKNRDWVHNLMCEGEES